MTTTRPAASTATSAAADGALTVAGEKTSITRPPAGRRR